MNDTERIKYAIASSADPELKGCLNGILRAIELNKKKELRESITRFLGIEQEEVPDFIDTSPEMPEQKRTIVNWPIIGIATIAIMAFFILSIGIERFLVVAASNYTLVAFTVFLAFLLSFMLVAGFGLINNHKSII